MTTKKTDAKENAKPMTKKATNAKTPADELTDALSALTRRPDLNLPPTWR